MKDFYDVIVAGGGPAGASIASELSKKLNVVVIEKGSLGETSRAWATWKSNAVLLPIVHRAKTGVFSSYRGARVENYDAGTLIVDEKKALSRWVAIARKRDATLQEKTSFLSYCCRKDFIEVRTSNGIFRGNLLIDAMGADSPIVKRHGHPKDMHYWSCFGYVVEHDALSACRAVILEDVIPGKPRPYFMYFPLGRRKGIAIVFFLGEKKFSIEFMKKKFKQVIESEEYADKFRKCQFSEEKFGWIPLMSEPIPPKDRILFVGDSAGWSPPITGCGFNRVVEKYRLVSKRIIEKIDEDDLSAESLAGLSSLDRVEVENNKLQEILFYLVSRFSDDDLDRLIRFLGMMNKKYEEDFLRSKLKSGEIRQILRLALEEFPLTHILEAIPLREYSRILSLVGELEEDYLVEEAREALRK